MHRREHSGIYRAHRNKGHDHYVHGHQFREQPLYSGHHFGHKSFGPGLGQGHRPVRHHLGGTSAVYPMDQMVINQINNPVGTSMMNAPFGNYYGRLGTPGGARATIASPAESLETPPYTATSSAVLYPPEPRYSQNKQYQTQKGVQNPSPVGFEGVHPQINPAPSLSNATLDYQVAVDGQRVEPVCPGHPNGKGEPYTDHFPQPGRITPDSMTDIHMAPPLKPRRRRRDRGDEDRGCCVIS